MYRIQLFLVFFKPRINYLVIAFEHLTPPLQPLSIQIHISYPLLQMSFDIRLLLNNLLVTVDHQFCQFGHFYAHIISLVFDNV